jgi:hypothetical protein
MPHPFLGFLNGETALVGCGCFSVVSVIIIVVLLLNKKSAGQTIAINAAPPPPGSRLYQIARLGSMIGTYPEATVASLIASGQIKPDDDYWTEGMANWQKVASNPSWK